MPLYELAIMTGRELARSDVEGAQLRLVTPEDRPFDALRGPGQRERRSPVGRGRDRVHRRDAGDVRGGDVALGATGESVAADCVVTLPLMRGPGLAGVPATQPDDFIPVDEYGRVEGLRGCLRRRRRGRFPVKQGGLAAQQADAVAARVAARHGARVDAAPFRPVLRGMLLTGGEPRFMRSDVPGADPDDFRRLVSALVAADEDRRSLSRAIPLGAQRGGGVRPSRRGLHRSRHPADGDDPARLTVIARARAAPKSGGCVTAQAVEQHRHERNLTSL